MTLTDGKGEGITLPRLQGPGSHCGSSGDGHPPRGPWHIATGIAGVSHLRQEEKREMADQGLLERIAAAGEDAETARRSGTERAIRMFATASLFVRLVLRIASAYVIDSTGVLTNKASRSVKPRIVSLEQCANCAFTGLAMRSGEHSDPLLPVNSTPTARCA